MSNKKKDDTNQLADLSNINSSVESDDNSATTTIKVSAPFELLAERRDKALKSLSKTLKSDGFRPGKVPTDFAAKQIPDIMVLDQAGRDLISEIYIPLLEKHSVDGIGEPKLNITKLADGNPFEFSITLAQAPSVELGDYQKIKSANQGSIDPEVSDDEFENSIKTLRFQWAQYQKYEEGLKDEAGDNTLDPRQIPVSDDELPELNDEFVKQLGDYEDVDDFKTKFKANIKANKALEELDKRRGEALDKIVADSSFKVPQIVYQSEEARLLELKKAEIEQAGIKFDDYLKSINKTQAELQTDLADAAKQNVHAQLVIAEIAKNEDLYPADDLIAKEVEYLNKLYPDANSQNIEAYVRSQLTSNLVLKWLADSTESNPADSK